MVRSTSYPAHHKRYATAVLLLSAPLLAVCQEDACTQAFLAVDLCFASDENDCVYKHRNLEDTGNGYYEVDCFSYDYLFCEAIITCPACAGEIWRAEPCLRGQNEVLVNCPLPTEEDCYLCLDEFVAEEACIAANGCGLESRNHRNLLQDAVSDHETCLYYDYQLCGLLDGCPACTDEFMATEPCFRELVGSADCVVPPVEYCAACLEEYDAELACYAENACVLPEYKHRNLQVTTTDPEICFYYDYFYCLFIEACPACSDEAETTETCIREQNGIADCVVPPAELCTACLEEFEAEGACFDENDCLLPEKRRNRQLTATTDPETCDNYDEYFCELIEECPACTKQTASSELCIREASEASDCEFSVEETCGDEESGPSTKGKKEGKTAKEGKKSSSKKDSYFSV